MSWRMALLGSNMASLGHTSGETNKGGSKGQGGFSYVLVSVQPGRAKPIVMSERANHPKLAHNRVSAQAVVAPRVGTTKLT